MKRLLLVDDDRIVSALITRGVADLPWSVETCADGEAAVARIATERWDLVLMDLELGEVSGADLTRQVRQREESTGARRTPIVALTAHREPPILRDALDAGCDGVLTKPVPTSLLTQTLARFARVVTPPARPASDVDDLADQFLADLAIPLEALGEAIERGNLEQARRIAHRLAGTSGSLGFDTLGDAAREVERAARDGDAEATAGAAERLVAAHGHLRRGTTQD